MEKHPPPDTTSDTPICASPDARAALATLGAVQPFLAIGVVAIVAGGIAAAVTGPTGWSDGSWVAAFLVLVVGVGQIGLATGQVTLAGGSHPSPRRSALQVLTFNAGSALVIAGTLGATPAVVTVGAGAVEVALVTFALGHRRCNGPTVWPVRGYRVLLAVLIISTPIGLVLAWVRG